jgi:hypothetical protein
MQINKLLYYYYKSSKVVFEKTIYKDTIFVSENLLININLFHKLKNKSNKDTTFVRKTYELT